MCVENINVFIQILSFREDNHFLSNIQSLLIETFIRIYTVDTDFHILE